jgi:DNA-binding CsgD family transcriptional regulator
MLSWSRLAPKNGRHTDNVTKNLRSKSGTVESSERSLDMTRKDGSRPKLYQRVQELHEQGMGIIKIGIELGLARNTVRKYLRQAPDPPLPTPRPLRESQLAPYEDYILKRWSQGERNAAQLFREVSALGYQGANTTVRTYVRHLRISTKDGSVPRTRSARARAVSPRALRWLLTRDRKDLDQEEQIRLDQLLSLSPEVESVHTLLHAFLEMVRERKPEQLRPWMQEATRSGIPEFKSFVSGIERDYDAVKAALRLPLVPGANGGICEQAQDGEAYDVRQGGICSPPTAPAACGVKRQRFSLWESLREWVGLPYLVEGKPRNLER